MGELVLSFGIPASRDVFSAWRCGIAFFSEIDSSQALLFDRTQDSLHCGYELE